MNIAAALHRLLIAGPVAMGRAVLRRPQLKYLARQVLAHFPSLRSRLQAMMQRSAMSPRARLSNRAQDSADLSPRTVRMLGALKHAAARRKAP